MTEATSAAATSPSPFAGGDWFDPLEEAVRRRVRAFIEELLEEELEVALGRGRCERDGQGPRPAAAPAGRQLRAAGADGAAGPAARRGRRARVEGRAPARLQACRPAGRGRCGR